MSHPVFLMPPLPQIAPEDPESDRWTHVLMGPLNLPRDKVSLGAGMVFGVLEGFSCGAPIDDCLFYSLQGDVHMPLLPLCVN